MDRSARQKLNRGYSSGFSAAFEITLVPAVFGGLGWLIDRALGTTPIFLIGLLVFGCIGVFTKLWIRYDAEMTEAETGKVWNRHKAGQP